MDHESIDMNCNVSRRSLLTLSLAPAAAGTGVNAHAQEWKPSKTVRIVVPIVGSTKDILARLVASKLPKALGQPVIVGTSAAPAAPRWGQVIRANNIRPE